jgi:hypothetical protein
MQKFVLGLCVVLAFPVSSRTQASTVVDIGTTTFALPQNGTLELSGPAPAGAQGTFEIIGNPSFSGSGFAVLNRTAVIDGASYSIQTGLGTCPVAFCGSFPYVTDNVFGSHPGPGGFSLFDISSLDPALTVSSNWTLQQLFPRSSIVIPADYQVEVNVSLPNGVAAVPEPTTWAMLLIGFVAFGIMAHRRSRKNFASIRTGC